MCKSIQLITINNLADKSYQDRFDLCKAMLELHKFKLINRLAEGEDCAFCIMATSSYDEVLNVLDYSDLHATRSKFLECPFCLQNYCRDE